DGIRDLIVTGVQTCALPISPPPRAKGAVHERQPESKRRKLSTAPVRQSQEQMESSIPGMVESLPGFRPPRHAPPSLRGRSPPTTSQHRRLPTDSTPHPPPPT